MINCGNLEALVIHNAFPMAMHLHLLSWYSFFRLNFFNVAGTLQLSVLPKVSAGTAKSLATWLTAAQMKGYAVTAASLATLQETALLRHCHLEKWSFAATATNQVIFVRNAPMRRPATTVGRVAILPATAPMILFATCAMLLVIWPVSAPSLIHWVSGVCHLPSVELALHSVAASVTSSVGPATRLAIWAVTAWLVPSWSATTVVAVATWLMSAPLWISWTASPCVVSEGRSRAIQMTFTYGPLRQEQFYF